MAAPGQIRKNIEKKRNKPHPKHIETYIENLVIYACLHYRDMCSAAVLPSRIAKEQAPSPELFAAAPQRFFAQSPPCCSSPPADVARPRDTLGGVQRIGGRARGEVDGEGACIGEVEV